MLKRITLKGEQKRVLFLPPSNPIQIKGVAGSGKTTVALYRAKHLLETQANLFQETKIVIFTFNKTLSAYIKALKPYVSGGYQKDNDEIKPKTADGLNVQIINFHSWAFRFIGLKYGQTINSNTQVQIIKNVINSLTSNSSNILNKDAEFFQEEISWMKGQLFKTESEYLEATRIGRGTSNRVIKVDKEVIWKVYENYNLELINRGEFDFDDYAILALKKIQNDLNFNPPYTHIIIDEAQDLNKAQILTISSLVDKSTNSLTIIADAAQRIYKSGFVWSEVGINVRGGRTIEFKKNYRNTVPIARAALSLLSKEKDQSEFTQVETALAGGEKPKIGYYHNFDEQMRNVIDHLIILNENNDLKGTVILHRSRRGVNRIKDYLDNNGFATELVKNNLPVNYESNSIKICTMSSIKGLEFNNVFIVDLNDDNIPYQLGFSFTEKTLNIEKLKSDLNLKEMDLCEVKLPNGKRIIYYDENIMYEFDWDTFEKIKANPKTEFVIENTGHSAIMKIDMKTPIWRVREPVEDDYHISTERRLLYTCMTRARKNLYLFSSTKVNPSRYLREIKPDLLIDISPKSFYQNSSTDDLPVI